MNAAPSTSIGEITAHERARLATTFLIEAILSFACSFLFIGIFFYTTQVFGWDPGRNFLLASGQGAAYVVSALASQWAARVMGARRLLIVSHIILAAISLAGVLVSNHAVLTIIIIGYVPLIAINWPVIEAAAAANADPHTLSRRIGLYNIIWAATGSIGLALQGTLMRYDARSVFFIPMVIHVVIVMLVLARKGYGGAPDRSSPIAPTPHLAPEPELLAQRTQALWLSRIALPSTYVVIYSLSAIMPLLPVMKSLDKATQTVVASSWLASRWLTFWFLGATRFWHTRPRLLLGAAVLMAVSFVAITAPIGLPGMILAQVLLGASVGLIYTVSLYIGMVLSDASTEHAGYHEALIGLGQILGPGIGALTQWRWPNDLRAGVIAVSALTAVTLVAAVVAAIRTHPRRVAG